MNTSELTQNLLNNITLSAKAHTEHPTKESKSVRGHDKTTPYFVHPTLGAMLILEDSKALSFEERMRLSKLFSYHDILEDTNFPSSDLDLNEEDLFILTEWLSIDGGSKDEYEMLVSKKIEIPAEVWYIKTVDKYINLINDEYFIKKGTLDNYIQYLDFYTKQAKIHYPNSFCVLQSELLLKNYLS